MADLARVAGLASAGLVNSLPATRDYVLRIAGLRPLRSWRALWVLLALLSWKNLPLVWHLRFYRALFFQLFLQRKTIPPGSLFEPVITTSRTSLWETDFNLHKSNSTYFSDLDISRTHFMAALLRTGVLASRDKSVDPKGPRAQMALGAVSCHFRREIKPFAKYEIWTRLLSWDRKWLYLVSYVVKAGAVGPGRYTLQPWRKGSEGRGKEESEEERKKRLRDAIYCTSVSRYVVKKGRLTIPAEVVLDTSKLLPPKPEGLVEAADMAAVAQTALDPAPTGAPTSNGVLKESSKDVLDGSFVLAEASEFTWEKVEAERVRGLRFAEMFGGLEELHDEFDGGVNGALGLYPDL